MIPPASQTGEVLPLSRVRQWAVLPDGMLLSTRAPDGSWVPVRRLGYDDLRLVYRYEVVDWSPIGWASLIWLFLAILTGIGLAVAGVPAEWIWAAAFAELAALIGGAIYRCLTKKRPMLRFEAYSGELVLPESNPLFFDSLSQALAAAETWRQSAAPLPEATGYPEPPGQPQWQAHAGLPPLWTPSASNAPATAPGAIAPDAEMPPTFQPPQVATPVEPAAFPPPSYSAPSSQSAENPPSPPLANVDSAAATGENERR